MVYPGYRGLGLISTVVSAGAPLAFQGVASLLGDTPDHDPAALRAWAQQVAATGAGICEGPFDPAEVMEAVEWAPEGREGDPSRAATYRGLYTAVYKPTLGDGSKAVDFRPFMRTRAQTARLAVGVAHGRVDCGVGWQEAPTVEHLRAILEAYRNRPPSVAQQVMSAAGGAVQSVTQAVQPVAQGVTETAQPYTAGLVTEDNKPAFVMLGLLAVGAVAAKMAGKL